MKRVNSTDFTTLIALDAMINTNMKCIRNMQVMLGSDVAKLYHVSPEELYRQVKKNIKRFPEEFIFKLTLEELKIEKDTIIPYVFTEQGILMIGASLKSEQAVKIHVQLVRYFVQLLNKNIDNFDKLVIDEKDKDFFCLLREMTKK